MILPALRRTLPAVVGGQAVLDGVMIRSPRFMTIAVRDVGGAIYADTRRSPSTLARHPWLGLPFVRGIAALYDALVNGARAIAASAAVPASAASFDSRELTMTLGVGVALALGVFFLLPAAVMHVVADYLTTPAAVAAGAGGLRIVFLLAYVGALAGVPDLRRVYQYHGAEHKAMNAWEAGLPLDVATVRGCSRFHVRCGTSFLFVVMLIAVAAFAWLPDAPFPLAIAARLALLPVIAGLTEELFRLAERVPRLRPVLRPGVWLQYLTTREPQVAQLEVAVRALRSVVDAEAREAAAAAANEPEIRTTGGFGATRIQGEAGGDGGAVPRTDARAGGSGGAERSVALPDHRPRARRARRRRRRC